MYHKRAQRPDKHAGGGDLDKYKKLISNTLIFAIGTFSSKVLVFLLVPFIRAFSPLTSWAQAT